MIRRSLALLLFPILACSSGTKASTGRSQHEADSVIANSQAPGAAVAKKALDAQDSARVRAQALDTVAAGQ